MLRAAERLFAEDGIEAVTLRDIGRAAGQRNNSVVHYHFGSKEALVDAAMQARFVPVNAERHSRLDQLAASGASGDSRAIVRAMVEPLAALLTVEDDGNPLAFLAQVISLPRYIAAATGNGEIVDSMRRACAFLEPNVDVDAATFKFRCNVALLTLVQTLAAAERSLRDGTGELPPKPAFVDGLVDALVGLITAPVSEAVSLAR